MDESIYLIAIDPGNNTGIAVFELDPVTLTILSIESYTVILNNLIPDTADVLLARNILLTNVCNKLSEIYNPHILAMESAFLNSRFPKAVMQLSQYTSTIEQAMYAVNNYIKIFKYPPKRIKKYIGGGGGADKNDMLSAIRQIPELTNRLNLSVITEHEVDALAIGYITIVNLRTFPHLLITY